MPELSVIVPFVNEYPQNIFTIMNLACELTGEVDFEIIAINNYCDEVAAQGREQDKGFAYLSDVQKLNPWLKVVQYEDKLSHWNAKNLGVSVAAADILFFCDAHCIVSKNSLVSMYRYYRDNIGRLGGTLHLPLSYMFEREGRELVYKLVAELERGVVHYSFTKYKREEEPYTVPCMSTCGMMITKKMLVDELGGWPTELGIYGGGENFINFTLATLGRTINIYPTKPLFHYAEKRGYNWNYMDFHRNRMISTYMYGDEDLVRRYALYMRGDQVSIQQVCNEVLGNKNVNAHRDRVKKLAHNKIEDWIDVWRNRSHMPLSSPDRAELYDKGIFLNG